MIGMKLRINGLVVCAVLLTVCGTAAQETGNPPTASDVVGLPLTGDEAVAYLSSAEVTGQPEDFDPLAITGPVRVTLTDGSRTLRAVFKDEDTLYPEFRFGDGRVVERAKDSYKHEIAAFELDRLLGLDIVPPCVERRLFKRKGSLCLWIEGAMTEDVRREKGLEPPDPEGFKDDLREIRLFQQLIADLDYSNIRNLVVDANFKVYKVEYCGECKETNYLSILPR